MNFFHFHKKKKNFFVGDQENSGGGVVKEVLTMSKYEKIFSLSGILNPFPSNLQNITTLKPLKLVSQNWQYPDLPIPNSPKNKNLERLYNCVVDCFVVWSVVCNAGLTARPDQTRLDRPNWPKCHQNWNVTKTEMFPKLKYHHNWNLPKRKYHQTWNVTKK